MPVYRVKSISLPSLAKFGCLLGGLIALAPGLVCGLTGLWVVGVTRRWLDGLQHLRLDLPRPLPSPVINGVELLRLGQVLTWLRFVDDWSPLFGLVVVLGLSLAAGLVLAAIVAVVGLGYNLVAALTGGLEIELEPPTPPV
jgi:hypothetical protein